MKVTSCSSSVIKITTKYLEILQFKFWHLFLSTRQIANFGEQRQFSKAYQNIWKHFFASKLDIIFFKNMIKIVILPDPPWFINGPNVFIFLREVDVPYLLIDHHNLCSIDSDAMNKCASLQFYILSLNNVNTYSAYLLMLKWHISSRNPSARGDRPVQIMYSSYCDS
jgi:hypothetical protein